MAPYLIRFIDLYFAHHKQVSSTGAILVTYWFFISQKCGKYIKNSWSTYIERVKYYMYYGFNDFIPRMD